MKDCKVFDIEYSRNLLEKIVLKSELKERVKDHLHPTTFFAISTGRSYCPNVKAFIRKVKLSLMKDNPPCDA